MGFSLSHLLILLIIVLIFFRPKKVPELGKSIGKAFKNFKSAMNEIEIDPKDIRHLPDENTKDQNTQKSTDKNKV